MIYVVIDKIIYCICIVNYQLALRIPGNLPVENNLTSTILEKWYFPETDLDLPVYVHLFLILDLSGLFEYIFV